MWTVTRRFRELGDASDRPRSGRTRIATTSRMREVRRARFPRNPISRYLELRRYRRVKGRTLDLRKKKKKRFTISENLLTKFMNATCRLIKKIGTDVKTDIKM